MVMWLSPLAIGTMSNSAVLSLTAHEVAHWIIESREPKTTLRFADLGDADAWHARHAERRNLEHVEVYRAQRDLGFSHEPVDSYYSDCPFESALAQYDPVRRFRRGEPLAEI
jgi:hypothetical protein